MSGVPANRCWPSGRWMAGLCIAFAAAVFAGPSHAHAGCGDYVIIGSPQPGMHEMPMHGSPDADSEQPGGKRCHGLLCSGDSKLPIVPAAPLVIEHKHWGDLAARVELVPSAWTLLPGGIESLHPIDRGARLYRPPR